MTAQGMGFSFVHEAIGAPTDWRFEEGHHVLVVHLAGDLLSMDSSFEKGPSGQILPQVGDIWVIPARRRYAALAQGDTVGFCEMTLPVGQLRDRELPALLGHRDAFVHHAVERLNTLAGREDDLARLLRESIAESIRLHLLDALFGPPREKEAGFEIDADLLARLLDELRSTLDEDHSLATMAARVGATPSDFLQGFSRACGVTPYQWLIRERIGLARTLLKSTSQSITAIGLATGFSTPSHFATSFKQHLGVSPSAYRRLVLGD